MPTRTIALELFGIVPGRSGGMETHTFETVRMLARLRPDDRLLLGIRPEARTVLGDLAERENCELFDAPLTGPLRRIPLSQSVNEWVRFQRRAAAVKADLLHATFAVVRPPWQTRPFVVTIPDMHYRTLKGVIGRIGYEVYDYHIRTTARRARRILTLSEHSKREIVRELGVDPGRVVVTYCGIDHTRFTPLSADDTARLRQSRPDLPDRFLLYPSALLPHKNHATLFLALHRLRTVHGIEIPLILTGTGATAFAADTRRRAEELGLGSQVRWAGLVSADELLTYYRLATAVVFPSRAEGFGLPVVEAMACGCPVACSNTTSVGEIAGTAAELFDPDDTDGMTTAVRRLWEDDDLRGRLSATGLRRAADFTWHQTASRTAAVYDELFHAG
jgi:glycosyltransferase involved in cell wall biosynthesis